MENSLLDRLETAVARLLEKNRQLQEECQSLRRAQLDWQREQGALLAEVDRILARLERAETEES
jgi:hypothetical protein